jgi:hypothetical protein
MKTGRRIVVSAWVGLLLAGRGTVTDAIFFYTSVMSYAFISFAAPGS